MFDPAPQSLSGRPAINSREGLVAWLRTQDPNTVYNYRALTDCAITRYLKAAGVRVDGVSRDHYSTMNPEGVHDLAPGMDDIVCPPKFHEMAMFDDSPTLSTYGEALARAEALEKEAA